MAEQDRLRVRPGGEVLRRLLEGGPTLILMDEVLNFLNTARSLKAGDVEGGSSSLASQFMAFVQSLSEEVSGRTGAVLVMALPKSELEMSPEDEADFNRLRKLSSRLDKPYTLATDREIPEIIRRRLFEDLGSPTDRRAVARAYARWVAEHRDSLAAEFTAEDFEACYPFHPTVLSVFERKWQTLPNFQRTRGVLRMLALWISQTYAAAYRGGHRDPLVTLGMAPLADPYFRAAVLEQLAETRLEGTILADIAGPEAHATRLDAASTGLRQFRLHQALATAIFFESSGGQSPQRQVATLPELRLALGRPELELGHLETALAELAATCFYLFVDAAAYRFSLQPNLNRVLSDIRASLDPGGVEERMREETRKAFRKGRLELRFFPERPADVPNLATLALVVLGPEHHLGEGEREATRALIRSLLEQAGAISRTYKSALFFVVPGDVGQLRDATRNLCAWERLLDQADERRLDEAQRAQAEREVAKARREVQEAVWRAYHVLCFLGEEGVEELDLGLLDPSAADSLTAYIESRLIQQDLLTDRVGASWLARHRPPAATPEWSLRDARDLFYSSPRYPRLLDPSTLRHTVAEGVAQDLYGLALRDAGGALTSVRFEERVPEDEVEVSEDSVLLTPELARALKAGEVPPSTDGGENGDDDGHGDGDDDFRGALHHRGLRWQGEVPSTKWALFYSRVVSKIALSGRLTLHVELISEPEGGLTQTQVDEVRQGLSDLGLAAPEVVEGET